MGLCAGRSDAQMPLKKWRSKSQAQNYKKCDGMQEGQYCRWLQTLLRSSSWARSAHNRAASQPASAYSKLSSMESPGARLPTSISIGHWDFVLSEKRRTSAGPQPVVEISHEARPCMLIDILLN